MWRRVGRDYCLQFTSSSYNSIQKETGHESSPFPYNLSAWVSRLCLAVPKCLTVPKLISQANAMYVWNFDLPCRYAMPICILGLAYKGPVLSEFESPWCRAFRMRLYLSVFWPVGTNLKCETAISLKGSPICDATAGQSKYKCLTDPANSYFDPSGCTLQDDTYNGTDYTFCCSGRYGFLETCMFC